VLGLLGFLMGGLALVVALAALGLTLFGNPFRGPLSKYNFSTPRDTLTSLAKLEANTDFPALAEISRIKNKKKLEEKLRTLDIRKESEWGGKKIMFCAYDQDGKKHYQVQFLEKDVDTGYWLPPDMFGGGSFQWEQDIRRENPELANWIQSFRQNGEFRNQPGAKDGVKGNEKFGGP
jgi:hypothetical protein